MTYRDETEALRHRAAALEADLATERQRGSELAGEAARLRGRLVAQRAQAHSHPPATGSGAAPGCPQVDPSGDAGLIDLRARAERHKPYEILAMYGDRENTANGVTWAVICAVFLLGIWALLYDAMISARLVGTATLAVFVVGGYGAFRLTRALRARVRCPKCEKRIGTGAWRCPQCDIALKEDG